MDGVGIPIQVLEEADGQKGTVVFRLGLGEFVDDVADVGGMLAVAFRFRSKGGQGGWKGIDGGRVDARLNHGLEGGLFDGAIAIHVQVG